MHGGDINLEEMTPAYYDTNLVLEDKMNTPSVPVEVQNIEHRMFDAIQNGELDSARAFITQLSKMTNGSHPSITEARLLVHRLSQKTGK